MTNYITEKELHEYIKKNFPEEDTDCDWKEMKNLKNSFNVVCICYSQYGRRTFDNRC